jgi:choline kinase
MTAAVVLAAGLGRRLSSLAGRPKWLVAVGASSPCEVQLRALAAHGVDHVSVVVGGAEDAIGDAVQPWREHLDVNLVRNHFAAERNNWYSALLGLEAVLRRADRDLVLLNSDLFARPAWFEQTLARLPCSGEAALAVDMARGRTDEAMKVALDPTGQSVTAIGKVGVPEPGGEYVGLAWFSSAGAESLCVELRAFAGDPACADNWYEHAIERHLRRGGRYGVIGVPSSDWVEIDDPADLLAASDLAARSSPAAR